MFIDNNTIINISSTDNQPRSLTVRKDERRDGQIFMASPPFSIMDTHAAIELANVLADLVEEIHADDRAGF